MSSLNYKATFQAKNKYLKFFCDNPLSEWDFENFKDNFRNKKEPMLKNLYIDCLSTVKENSKDMTSGVAKHINKLLTKNEKENHANTINHYYSGDVIHANTVNIDNRRVKKQKIYNESRTKKEEKEEEDADWLEIFEDKDHKDFHKYSPEKNGVVRRAPKLKLTNIEVENSIAKKIKKIVNVIQRKKPSITYSEAVYNDRFVFRLMDALLDEFDEDVLSPFFLPGEEELFAMSKQVKTMKADHRKIYKADGIVRINDDLELMLVETAGPFRKDDACKTAFDNSKGMFALLAMLKTIADKYYFASCQSFKKLKVLYLQPSDCYLRLWQMNYNKNGHYEYIRVAKAVVSDEEKEEEACLRSLNQFVMKMKECLAESLEAIRVLQEEHEEKKAEAESDNYSHGVYLSDVICPKIFKISYGKHSRGFSQKANASPYSQ